MPARALHSLADRIDPARTRALRRELGSRPERSVAVLLGTAFPPMAPARTWQVEALEGIGRDGWRLPWSAERVGAEIRRRIGWLGDAGSVKEALRRVVWTAKARIALRELLPVSLGGADVDLTSQEIAGVAEAAFGVALEEAARAIEERHGPPRRSDGGESGIVVLGLGKLGGSELNAGSDVDVNFVYDVDDGGSEVDLHQHWTLVARRVVATLEEPTPDGSVWRVDLRLRPEGSQGPIVNSVAATERYYETWGRLWERAALLRARTIAGDARLGRELEAEVIGPFVYRGSVDPSIATSLAELVVRSRAELSEAPERDLKLGPGGIREAEFFTQALQLIWGGREPSLRVRGTLAALERLGLRGLVTDRERREIADAYLLLRRVEHAIQWRTGLQTHTLPPDASEVAALGRLLGYEDGEQLLGELDRARGAVHDRFRSLAPSEPRPLARFHSVLLALGGDDDGLLEAVEATFGAADLADHLRSLARRPDDLLGPLTLERFPDLPDQVLGAIAGSPDPEQAARYYRSFFGRFVSPSAYVAALAEEPRRAHRMATVFGGSALVGDAVVAHPDLADILLFGGDQPGSRAVQDAVAEEIESFERRARSRPAVEEDADEEFVGALRRAKGKVTIEVAVADLAGGLDVRSTTRRLSELADCILDRTTRFVLGSVPGGLAVVALGKLGGLDIGYASDLDVLFVYDPAACPAGKDAAEHFSRLAQRIIRLVSTPHPAGPGYELDTRLRPSGRQGLLVTSLPAFARYHGVGGGSEQVAVQSSGAAWERQALLRARACAGDADLGRRVIDVARVAAYERGAPPAREMRRLRSRMERELGAERPGRHDVKVGRGGLLDIEFAVQWLQMRHGRDPTVRTTDTGEALETLRRIEALSRADYEVFRDGYSFLRGLEQRMHVLRGAGSSVVDERSPGLSRVARGLGFADTPRASARDRLLARYADVTRAVRMSYGRVLGG